MRDETLNTRFDMCEIRFDIRFEIRYKRQQEASNEILNETYSTTVFINCSSEKITISRVKMRSYAFLCLCMK